MAGLLDIITTGFLERAKSASSAGARFLGTKTGFREAFGGFSQKFLPGKQRFGQLDESTPELGNILGLINRLDVPEARRQALFQNLLRGQLTTRQEAFGFQATSGAPPELPQQQQPRIQGASIEAPQPQQFTPGDPSTLQVLSGQQRNNFSQFAGQRISQGNLPQRNNNPGNIKRGGGIGDQLAIGTDQQGHLIFRTPEDGFKALQADLRAKVGGASRFLPKNPTVQQLARVYAEDPDYARKLSSLLGVSLDTGTANIPFNSLVSAIAQLEGFFAR